MDVARSIAALVATSKREDRRRKVSEAELDTPATVSSRKASKVAELPEKLALLDRLFNGLEFVLGALAGRQCRPTFPVVKDGVERMTGRDFTEERLSQVWAAAGDMLGVRWVTGELEVLQLAADGEARVPLGNEQAARVGQFRDALLGLKGAGEIPCRTLPGRPPEPQGPAAHVECSVPRREPEAAPSAGGQAQVDFQSRGEMLRARILAREQAAERHTAWAAQVSEVELKLRACEDALGAHGVVQQLLVRAKGTDACCTEAEVLTALCGTASSMRNRRALDPEAARAALATLVGKAADWFARDVGKFTGRPFLQRTLNGSGANAAQRLRLEIEALTSQRRALLAVGPGGGARKPDSPGAALEAAVASEEATAPRAPAASPKPAFSPSSDVQGCRGGERRRAPVTLSAPAVEVAAPGVLEEVRAARPRRAEATRAAAKITEQDPAEARGRPRRAAAAAALAAITAQREIARPRTRTPVATRARCAQGSTAPEARRRVRGKSAAAAAAAAEPA